MTYDSKVFTHVPPVGEVKDQNGAPVSVHVCAQAGQKEEDVRRGQETSVCGSIEKEPSMCTETTNEPDLLIAT